MTSPKHPHLDFDDENVIEQEIKNLRDKYPHLDECAADDGGICPSCGSSEVESLHKKEEYTRLIRAWRCLECPCKWIQYAVDFEKFEKWEHEWHQNVITYSIEGYPYYIYFRPYTHILDGIGPNIFPWEKVR